MPPASTVHPAPVLGPDFEIRKEAVTSAGGNPPAEPNAVVFAARVVSRAWTTATVTTPGAQTAPSVSRQAFLGDRAETGIRPERQEPPAPTQPGTSNSPTKPISGQEAARTAEDHQTPADPGAGHDTGERHASDEDTGPAGAHANTGPESPLAAEAPSRSTVSGIATSQPPVVSSPEPRFPSGVKAPAESAARQVPDVPGDDAARNGESVRVISLRLSSADQGAVQVRLSERAGELHLSVRTPDTGLSRGLRDNLSDLVKSLETNGYSAETWRPGGGNSSFGQSAGHEAPWQGNSSQQRDSGGPGGGRQQNPQQQQQDGEPAPRWLQELESSLQRSKGTWEAR